MFTVFIIIFISQKAADVKVTESEASKKGKSKAKNIDALEQEVLEIDIADKAAAMTKGKRGKKAQETNGEAQINGVGDDAALPAKKGKKKNELVTDEKTLNGDNSTDEETNPEEELNSDHVESNGTTEDIQPASIGRGRKKQVKKDEKPKETISRGRKAKQASEAIDEKEVNDEKPKGKGRGRKALVKAEVEDKTDNADEEVKPDSNKGKKRGQGKKEKTPESEKELSDREQKTEELKKKGAKSRKGKKAQAKDEVEDKKEIDEQEDVKESASKKRKVTKKDDKGKGGLIFYRCCFN